MTSESSLSWGRGRFGVVRGFVLRIFSAVLVHTGLGAVVPDVQWRLGWGRWRTWTRLDALACVRRAEIDLDEVKRLGFDAASLRVGRIGIKPGALHSPDMPGRFKLNPPNWALGLHQTCQKLRPAGPDAQR